MAEPEIAAKKPLFERVEPGSYWWCACGRSKMQPFCDGSHAGSEYSPVEVTIAEAQDVWWCQCKRTGNQPHCDGTHKTL
jgi:CDGSH-type Zn-finger protein